jgi:hypothetical protein
VLNYHFIDHNTFHTEITTAYDSYPRRLPLPIVISSGVSEVSVIENSSVGGWAEPEQNNLWISTLTDNMRYIEYIKRNFDNRHKPQ